MHVHQLKPDVILVTCNTIGHILHNGIPRHLFSRTTTQPLQFNNMRMCEYNYIDDSPACSLNSIMVGCACSQDAACKLLPAYVNIGVKCAHR